jgi:dihydroneopterin aldolase
MTLLLASVTGPEEAERALQLGADIIDLKDPSRRALGALPVDLVRRSVALVAGRRDVSAVTGDLPMDPDTVSKAAEAMAETGVDYLKVGLFPGPGRRDCIAALASLGATNQLIGVLFADCEPDLALLGDMARAGFAGAMIDTARKGAGRLLDYMNIVALNDFVHACRAEGLLAGLAGSLEAPDVPRLLLVEPDYLGFRGALCVGNDRTGILHADRVRLIRELISPDPRSKRTAKLKGNAVGVGLLSAQAYARQSAPEADSDHVLVRDFILPVRVGVYSHEASKPQNVRFNVDVTVHKADRPAADMRDVLSYDVITDAIRITTGTGHIGLLETLGERIAASLLSSPWVVAVSVEIEKLDLGHGRVGVEVRRKRSDVACPYGSYASLQRGENEAAWAR